MGANGFAPGVEPLTGESGWTMRSDDQTRTSFRPNGQLLLLVLRQMIDAGFHLIKSGERRCESTCPL
ncbi:hypothetical protein X747_22925 [Mesorhizobium sp. LNJC384A00]|nr:hypothetical protein X747_22925 [Mesorhizobium sp. LNJC384A00]